MSINALNWISFLEMVSVERTREFISELSLPIESGAFPSVMNWSRAHLEVHIFSSMLKNKGKREKISLNEVWENYRAISGVLEEKTLFSFARNYHCSNPSIELTYLEVNRLLNPKTVSRLGHWFRNNFTSSMHPEWLWFHFLSQVITMHNNASRTNLQLKDHEYELIQAACDRYYSTQRSFDIRFHIIEKKAELSGPSIWERVLQDFWGEEGTLKYYPWLGAIKKCIWNRHIRLEWGKLKSLMDKDSVRSIIDEARRNLIFLSWNQEFPEEPKPL